MALSGNPSQAQLALAMALVNSKPPDVPMQEYIIRIRSHIKQQGHPFGNIGPAKYFDSVSFWKAAYEKARDAQTRLNNRIQTLEQSVASLKRKESCDDGAAEEPAEQRSKGDSTTAEPPKKRPKRTTASDQSTYALTFDNADDLLSKLPQADSDIETMMMVLWSLQNSLKKKLRYSTIARHALGLCGALSSVALAIFKQKTPTSGSLSPSRDSLQPQHDQVMMFQLLGGVYKILCQALNKLLNSTEGQKYAGQLTFQLTSLFGKILHALGERCVSQTMRSPARHNTRLSRAGKNLSDQSGNNSPKDTISEHAVRLLALMMLSCTALVKSYEDVLEGYLYILFKRVGMVLSAVTFNELISDPDLRAETEQLPLPAGLVDVSSEGVVINAAENEARYLVWLLEKAMAVMYSVSMQPAFTEPENSETNKGTLLRFAKRRLQSTLLRAALRDDEPLFLDSLKPPAANGETMEPFPDADQRLEGPAAEWYPREVWRLLGWDILESVWKVEK